MPSALDKLVAQVRRCRVCKDAPKGPALPHEPRPVLRVSSTARIGIFSQAPGTRVHASGMPFTDASGVRLRAWMNVCDDEFYDVTRIAIMPMGFCFPGQDAAGGDLPPRRECAPLWRARLLAELPQLEVVLDDSAVPTLDALAVEEGCLTWTVDLAAPVEAEPEAALS